MLAGVRTAVLIVGLADAAGARSACPGELERAARTAALLEQSWPVRGGGAVLDLVRDIGATLAAHAPAPSAPWSFLMLDDDRLNAFSIGGGRIYVSRGTVTACRSEAELAAVIAHEMAHDLVGHLCARSSSRSEGRRIGPVRQRLDPVQEREADAASLPLLVAAGYDPHAALAVVRRVEQTDPDDPERVGALAAHLEGTPTGGRGDSPAFRALTSPGSVARRRGSRRSARRP